MWNASRSRGEPIALAEGLEDLVGLPAAVSVSHNGVLAYWRGAWGHRTLVWTDRDGNDLGRVDAPPGVYLQPALSPDGSRIATQRNESRHRISNVWLQGLSPGVPSRFTFFPSVQPVWSPDGTELFYLSRDGHMMAVAVQADALSFERGAARALFTTRFGDPFRNDYAVTSDGERFLVVSFDEEAASQPITVMVNWAEGLNR